MGLGVAAGPGKGSGYLVVERGGGSSVGQARLTLWQLPNPALCVWMVAVVLGWFELPGTHATAVDGVRHGALLVWTLDELVRGASPFRHLLGAVILAAQLAHG